MYSNSEQNYRLDYPAGWHISAPPGKGGPTLYTYELSSAPAHGLLPEGGAEILILPHADLKSIEPSRSPSKWAADVRRFAAGRTVPETIGDAGELRVAFDYRQVGSDGTKERYVAYYFKLNGQSLKAGLNYWNDDPMAASYQQALKSIVRSIRPIAARRHSAD